MKKVNLVIFSDLLYHAGSIGYNWNEACDILDDIRPQYETYSCEYERSDFDYEGADPAIKEIMVSYFKKKKVKKITVIRD